MSNFEVGEDETAPVEVQQHISILGRVSAVVSEASALGSVALESVKRRVSTVGRNTINEAVLERVSEITTKEKSLFDGGGVPPANVEDLSFFASCSSKAEKNQGCFFRLAVEQSHITNGFVLQTKSANGGKFKMLIFDVDGNPLVREDSQKSTTGSFSSVSLFMTSFPTYLYNSEGHFKETRDGDVPHVFNSLQCFRKSSFSLKSPGRILIVIYGDNIIGGTSFSLAALPCQGSINYEGIVTIDQTIEETKLKLDAQKIQFIAAKEAYEEAKATSVTMKRRVDTLLETRESAYNIYLSSTNASFALDDTQASTAFAASKPSTMTQVSEGAQKLATSGIAVASSAAATASATAETAKEYFKSTAATASATFKSTAANLKNSWTIFRRGSGADASGGDGAAAAAGDAGSAAAGDVPNAFKDSSVPEESSKSISISGATATATSADSLLPATTPFVVELDADEDDEGL